MGATCADHGVVTDKEKKKAKIGEDGGTPKGSEVGNKVEIGNQKTAIDKTQYQSMYCNQIFKYMRDIDRLFHGQRIYVHDYSDETGTFYEKAGHVVKGGGVRAV